MKRHAATMHATIGLLSFAGSAHAQSATSVDFDGDCEITQTDAQAFGAFLSAGDVRAELTGDDTLGLGDSAAYLAASGNAPGTFWIHWSVTTHYGTPPSGIQYRMDQSDGEDPLDPDLDVSALPVLLDTAIFYRHACGYYPPDGLHQLLAYNGLSGPTPQWNGDVNDWQTNYSDWQADHSSRVTTDVEILLDSRDPPYTYAVIDYEEWLLTWQAMQEFSGSLQDTIDAWEDCVTEIHLHGWDTAFCTLVGFSIPSGTIGIGNATQEQRDELYELSWDHFAKDFQLDTLATARAAGDNVVQGVKWGFWGYPKVPWAAPVDEDDQARNDALWWLYEEVDFFAPSFYRQRYSSYSVPDASSCDSDRTDEILDQAEVWASGMIENLRLQDECNPGAEIIPYIWWAYDLRSQSCFHQMVNDLDAEESFRVPRRWGADGVFIWGAIEPTDPTQAEDKDLVQDQLDYWDDTLDLFDLYSCDE